MIVFDLKCSPQGHVFEAWFGSGEDYEAQRARGLVACPLCETLSVEKAAMAPWVGAKANSSAGADSGGEAKAMLARLAVMQRKLLASSDNVGDRFADEARAIHLGDADARAIHGRATRAETAELLDEGIPIAPLPLPVVDPGDEN